MPEGYEQSPQIVRNEALARSRRPLGNQSVPGASNVILQDVFFLNLLALLGHFLGVVFGTHLVPKPVPK